MSGEPFVRVNGEMLMDFRGRNVCMLGKLKKTMPDSTSFELETPDGKSTLVKLKMPIRDMLSNIVEVYGSVDEKCNIQCVNYATFEEDMINNFDMNLYNETVQMTHQLRDHYVQG